MYDERCFFEKGCFLPNWNDDSFIQRQESPVESVMKLQNKDLNTLLTELEQIKQHIQDVRQRQWHLAKLIEYHENGFVRE